MTMINLFHIHRRYIFKHYFDESNLFKDLRDYYDRSEYRFEVEEDEVDSVIEKLEGYGYRVHIVERDEIPDYTLIIDKYDKQGDLLKNSVEVIELGDEKALVLKSKVAKEEAMDRGKEPNERWKARL
uniref:Uncharacterized protein n=1 Tax=uncultured organism TaxID=155900 RepID=M1P1Y4_9ZZZZ|nr:hypothetical protein FLSS-25_0007 [uncultured organism]